MSATKDIRRAEVLVLRVFMARGQRMVVVGPCPYCGWEHQHLWRPGDREPGSRVAPCTARKLGTYVMVATPEQIGREESRRRGGRR